MPRRDHFDLLAGRYDRLLGRANTGRILELLQPRPGDRILDVGGGTGRVAQDFDPEHRLIVCDASFEMVRQARLKGLIACCCSAEHLPFAGDSFDRAIMVDAFHHLRDGRLAAAELLRVLRPNGRAVVEEPDIGQRWIKLIAFAERLFGMRSTFHSGPDLVGIFAQAGGTVAPLAQEPDINVRLVIERPSCA